MKKISFCINTAKNELNHIKLLFNSLQQNLKNKNHEIIVFIDSDNQGTSDWLIKKYSQILKYYKILFLYVMDMPVTLMKCLNLHLMKLFHIYNQIW
jgi:glycosyltransferase involved in cell wall biosynthesis